MANDLNEVFEEAMQDAAVITVPIDETLSNSGEAADAAAVGAALELKADLADISNIKVNDQAADNQGQILLDGRDVPMSDTDTTTLTAAITAAGNRTAADIAMSGSDATTLAEKVSEIETAANRTGESIPLSSLLGAPTIEEAVSALQELNPVRSVNGDTPDDSGDVAIQRVNLAGNLETEFKANSEGAFLQRMTGGSAAIVDGESNMISIMGNSVRTGYVEEIIAISVDPVDSDSNLAATINKATWRGYVEDSDTYAFTYATTGTTWKLDGTAVDLDDYGITVTGTPANGDVITVIYQQETRGTIRSAFDSNAEAQRFVATGWNLFQNVNGYAKVVRYSNEYGYKVSGAFTALQFSTTVGGSRSAITPAADGTFQVPSDGYVFVTGGDGTTTAIYPTWSDWSNGYPGSFQAFDLTEIDITSIIANYFPGGMFSINDIRDEIDIVNGKAISRIEAMEYTDANLATAVASGRAYTYDESSIYLARTASGITQNTYTVVIDGAFTANDHGTEYFEGSDIPVYCKAQYNANLKNKLERDTVTISQQTLSASDQEQIRTNIGAAGQAAMNALLNGMVVITEHSRTLDADIATNKTKTIAAADFTPAVAPISGYTPIAVLLASTLSALIPYTFVPTTSGTVIGIRNFSTVAAGNGKTVKIRMIWVKNEFLG